MVFDLDGTLVDSATDLASAASALTVELGGRPLTRAEIVAMVGDGAAVLVRRVLAAAALDPETPGALDRFLALYDARLLDTTRLYPGIREALDRLDPLLTLTVLTNKPRRPAERVLEGLGVRPLLPRGRRRRRAVAAQTRSRRPAFASAARRRRADGLVGDSPVDAETADRGGVPFVLAGYGFGAASFDHAPTRFVAASPADLPRVIRAALAAAAAPTA